MVNMTPALLCCLSDWAVVSALWIWKTRTISSLINFGDADALEYSHHLSCN